VLTIFLVALALSSVAQAQTVARRNPNVCADVAAGVITMFRNDYAACEAYFWCDGPQARPTTPCRTGFAFDEANQVCDQAALAACLECPAAGNIAVN
jgi:Chitin binding Peritrophin-A domain